MKVWKRNAVVITVLLFVCVGLYLNWSYNKDAEVSELTDVIDSSKVLGDSTLVIDKNQQSLTGETAEADAADIAAAETGTDAATTEMGTEAAATESGAAVVAGDKSSDSVSAALDVTTATSDEYFDSVRLTRQQTRDEAMQTLSDEASSTDDDTALETVNNEIQNLVELSLDEAQIESLVIAKGYTDCVAFMGDDGISVVVTSPTGGLLDSDVAKITDIVTSQTELDVADIKIIEVK